MKTSLSKHRSLSGIRIAIFLALLASSAMQAQTVLLNENFNRASLGGQIGPTPMTDQTGLSPIQNLSPTVPGFGPAWINNDQGIVVNDLRGLSEGKAFKFNDKVMNRALQGRWGLAAGPDSSQGILSIGWDLRMDVIFNEGAYELFSQSRFPLQFTLYDSAGQNLIINFLIQAKQVSINEETVNQFAFYGTNGPTSSVTSLFGGINYMEANTTYRIELDLNLEAHLYYLSLYDENGELTVSNTTGFQFPDIAAINYFGGSQNLMFQGGAADFLATTGGEGGPIMDNLLATYTIPEPGTASLLLLGGLMVVLGCRRRAPISRN